MIIKAPGFFKKTLTEKQLQKNYLRFLEQPGDKSFILSSYVKDDEGYTLKKDFDKEEVKKLKLLQKDIKNNKKGAVKLVPLLIIGAIIFGIVFFFTVMLNPLLKSAMEAGLEAVFEARVESDNFRIDLFQFEISMTGLTIADRDAPMRNLIQFDTIRLKLKPEALLRGRVYIEEIRADSIRFGTPRTVSGALPERAPRVEEPREPIEIPPLIDLENFDAMVILNQEFNRLQTPLLYESAMDTYETSLARWRSEEASARERIAELQSRAEPFMQINVNDFLVLDVATIELINSTINDINAFVNTVQAAQNDINGMISGVQNDINTVRALEQNARNAFTADLNHLRSFIDLESGEAVELLTVIVMDILTDTAQEYLAYGMRGLELLEQLIALQAQLPKSEPRPPEEERFRGRDVIFPTVDYPQFFLGIMAADVLTPSSWHWAFDLQNISSNPYYAGSPASLSLSLLESGDGLQRFGSLRSRADFRSTATERFNAEFSGGGFPVDIALRDIGIGSVNGRSNFDVELSGMAGGGFALSGDLSLLQANLTNPSNTFAQAADEAIRQVNSVDFGINYEHRVNQSDRFSVNTNIGDIFWNALQSLFNQYRRQAEEALEAALREKIEEFLEDTSFSMDDLEMLVSAISDHRGTVDAIRSSLDQKKAELESRVRSAADDAIRQLEEEARQQIEQAADEARQQMERAAEEALQNITPNIPIPNIPIPSLPGPFGR